MLKVLKSGDQQWCEFTAFDENARAILFASPSAVIGYDDLFADLLDYDSGTNKYLDLRDDAGLIRTVTYDPASTYLASEAVQEGQLGSLILLRELEYCCVQGGCECGGSSSSSSSSAGSGCASRVYMLLQEIVYPHCCVLISTCPHSFFLSPSYPDSICRQGNHRLH